LAQDIYKSGWLPAGCAEAMTTRLLAKCLIAERRREQPRGALWRFDAEGDRMEAANTVTEWNDVVRANPGRPLQASNAHQLYPKPVGITESERLCTEARQGTIDIESLLYKTQHPSLE
jgi:hypothetical protein